MYIQGLPCSSDGKDSACNVGDSGSIPGQEDLLEKWQLTPAFLPGESHGQRGLTGYGPWGCKESDLTEQLTLLLYNMYNLKLYAKSYEYVYIELFSHVQLFWGPMDCSPPGSFLHGIFPGKNPRAGCHFLLQGIFPTPGLNPCFLHWQVGLFFFNHWATREAPVYIYIHTYVMFISIKHTFIFKGSVVHSSPSTDPLNLEEWGLQFPALCQLFLSKKY